MRRVVIILMFFITHCHVFSQSIPAFSPDSLLSRFERQLYAISIEKGELIPVYFVQLDDLKIRLDTISAQIKQIYPSDNQMITRIRKVRNFFDSLQPLILEKMQRIDLVFYEEAIKSRNRTDTSHANSLFIRSLQHNPGFGPAAYELIKLNLHPNKYADAVNYYEQYGCSIDSFSNPYYYNLIHGLAPAILDNIIAGSAVMIQKDLPADAFGILKIADYFNTQHPTPSGLEKTTKAYSDAYTGMYLSLVTIAERAFTAKKWELARNYYSQAQQYQQQNAAYVTDDRQSREGLEKTNEAAKKKIISKKKPRKSKHKGRKRRAPTTQRHKATKPSRIKPVKTPDIQVDTMARYYLSLADSSLKHQRYHESLSWCDSAARINEQRKSLADTLISRISALSARRIILDTVYSAYFLAWKNDLDKAEQILSMATTYQTRYFLNQDKEVASAVTELRDRIKDRKCFTARSDFEASVYRALSRFIRSEFLEGSDFLHKARIIYNESKDCGLSDTMLVKVSLQYQGLIRWQEHWNEARQAWSVKDYKLFYRAYDSSYRVFLTEHLSSKGLTMKPLLQYLEGIGDVEASSEIASVYLTDGKLEESWALLKHLKNNAREFRPSDSLMILLGESMAQDDRSKGEKRWIRELKSSGSYFRKAKKSYFRALKKT
ncbi:MAG: hypothetical protein AB9842_09845 [Bacteroidales bacterium]